MDEIESGSKDKAEEGAAAAETPAEKPQAEEPVEETPGPDPANDEFFRTMQAEAEKANKKSTSQCEVLFLFAALIIQAAFINQNYASGLKSSGNSAV